MSSECENKVKRMRLSFVEKLEVIRLIDDGMDKRKVADVFNISTETVRRTLRERDRVEEASKDYELSKKKSSKSSAMPVLENAVNSWFYQARECGDVINGPLLCDKARELWNNLSAKGIINANQGKTFTASQGWLEGYKLRNGIRLNPKGEISSSDLNSVEAFRTNLISKIEKEGIQLQNVYNADESGIHYQSITRITLESHLKCCADGGKENKQRFTVLFCSNSNGSHKLQLFCIGDCMKLEDIKNQSLPVIYREEKGGWMTSDLFLDWYKSTFIPEVKKNQRETGIGGKVILLLDNAPSHPKVDVLNAINPDFEVMFFPPSSTALMQPCEQGLISTTKRKYRRKLLAKLHQERGEKQRIIEILENITLNLSFMLLSAAWDEVQSSTLRRVWEPLLGTMLDNIDDSSSVDVSFDTSADNLTDTEMIREIVEDTMPEQKGNIEIIEEIHEWFNKDNGDTGWRQQSLDEIVEILSREHEEHYKSVNYKDVFVDCGQPFPYSGDKDQPVCTKRSTAGDRLVDKVDKPISSAEALKLIKILQKYFEQQNDLSEVETLQTIQSKIERDLKAPKIKNITTKIL